MQSILITGKDTQKLKEEAQKLCSEYKISKFDIEIFQTEKAVGIGDIRTLQKKIFLKPAESEKKAIILEAFFGMTNDSQNAFLKILEEPPESTIIIVLVTSLDFILPTVMSRCALINVGKLTKLTNEEIADNLRLLSALKNSSATFALKISQDNGKNREDALRFLEGLLVSAQESLGKNDELTPSETGKVLKNLQKTHTIIKTTNVSPRFALENLFLNLF